MLILIPAILATLTGAIFVFLMLSAGDEIEETLKEALVEDYDRKVQEGEVKIYLSEEFLKKTHQEKNFFEGLKIKNMQSQLKTDRKALETVEEGKVDITHTNSIVGYRAMQVLKWNASYPAVLSLIRKCNRYMNRGEAVNYAYLTMAKLLGNAIFGFFIFFAVITFAIGLKLGSRGILIAFIILILIMVFGYLPMDAIRSTLEKRSAEIEREFP